MKIKGIIYAAGTILMVGCILYLSVTIDQPLFMYTSAIDTSLIVSNDKMIGACSVTGYHGQVIKVAAYMYLQRKEDDGTYRNISCWYQEKDKSFIHMERFDWLELNGTYQIMMVLNIYHKVMQYEVIQTYSNNVVYGGSNGWVYK